MPRIKLFIFTFRFCLFCQLNIYTPLPQSAQAQVVPEKSGIIQSGITTAREGIQPFAQAGKVLILILHLTLHQCLIVDQFCQTDSAAQLSHIVSNLPRLHTGRYEWGVDKYQCKTAMAGPWCSHLLLFQPWFVFLSYAVSVLCNPLWCKIAAAEDFCLKFRVQQEAVTCAYHTLQRDVTFWQCQGEETSHLHVANSVWRLLYCCWCVGALVLIFFFFFWQNAYISVRTTTSKLYHTLEGESEEWAWRCHTVIVWY